MTEQATAAHDTYTRTEIELARQTPAQILGRVMDGMEAPESLARIV